jgi:hypothetical protein
MWPHWKPEMTPLRPCLPVGPKADQYREVASRLLKNKFWEGQAPNILYASLLDYTFRSASLVASARFSAAC